MQRICFCVFCARNFGSRIAFTSHMWSHNDAVYTCKIPLGYMCPWEWNINPGLLIINFTSNFKRIFHSHNLLYSSSQYKRYKMYVNVLHGSKLESKLRDKPRGSGRSVESIMLQMKRCSSLGDLDLSSGYKGRNVRESYFMAIHKG